MLNSLLNNSLLSSYIQIFDKTIVEWMDKQMTNVVVYQMRSCDYIYVYVHIVYVLYGSEFGKGLLHHKLYVSMETNINIVIYH